jgi:uncharacterized membrane protein YjdF
MRPHLSPGSSEHPCDVSRTVVASSWLGKAMRENKFARRNHLAAGLTPHPVLRATFSRKGRREVGARDI